MVLKKYMDGLGVCAALKGVENKRSEEGSASLSQALPKAV